MSSVKLAAFLTILLSATVSQAQWRDTRPTRGVWLRPPTTIALLEVQLQNYANAGLTDLYLETFYWGLSTGKQGVFNRRFTFDYLDQAIPLAARYGIKVHAWIESGYWQYQSVGAYNFTSNPEWRVINTATGTFGGDAVDQVFANLTNPGVQAKLKSYCTELAQYPGLWSVQTDYHRMPVDNSTTDAFTAPWSYDTVSNTAFKAIYGAAADITTTARQSGQTNWNNFLTWRRNGITECANQMKQGVVLGSTDVQFSSAIFASAMTSSSQLSKCQNWPAWASAGYVDQVVPMAYGSTLSSIATDVNLAVANASGKPVIPGLAISGTATHPALTDQLNQIRTLGIEDYIIWEGLSFDTAQNRTDNLNWVNTAKKVRADFDDNGVIDKRDWELFAAVYDGAPEAGSGRMDMDGNSIINQIDSERVRDQLRKSRFGPFGKVEAGDWTRFNAAQTGSTTSNSTRSLYNLDGDGDVDAVDRSWLEFFGTTAPQIFVDVALQDSLLPADQTYTIELRNSADILQYSLTRKAKSNGQVILWVPGAGNYRVSIKQSHWLRKTSAVTVGTSDVVLSIPLINGDIVEDNFIGFDDFDILSGAFNNSIGDPGFVPNADLNGDDFVGFDDFDILSASFNLSGDD